MLAYSRFLWDRFCPNQKLAAVLRCHIEAFADLGGVPEEILYDRMKTVVVGPIWWILARRSPWSTTRRWWCSPITTAISRGAGGPASDPYSVPITAFRRNSKDGLIWVHNLNDKETMALSQGHRSPSKDH